MMANVKDHFLTTGTKDALNLAEAWVKGPKNFKEDPSS